MKQVLRKLNYVETPLLLWGNPFDTKGKDIVLCIPGNPGLSEFYIKFASMIHKITSLPVCVTDHAGFENIPNNKSQHLENQEHLFNLDGQLKHKLDLINNYLDKDVKLHIIGHSIGAWMIVELFDKNEELFQRTSSINLLFPTLQKMAVTKNGWVVNNIYRKCYHLLLILSSLVSILPRVVTDFIIKLFLSFKSWPLDYCDSIYKVITPTVVKMMLGLGFEEMDTVVSLNYEGLGKIKHITNVIYATCDNWTPLEYMEDLKTFQPQLQMQEVDVAHAFVLESSERIANMVSQFINVKKST